MIKRCKKALFPRIVLNRLFILFFLIPENLFAQTSGFIEYDSPIHDFAFDAVEFDDDILILYFSTDFTSIPYQSVHRNLIVRYNSEKEAVDSISLESSSGLDRSLRLINYKDSLIIVLTSSAVRTDSSRLRVCVLNADLELIRDEKYGDNKGSYFLNHAKLENDTIYAMGGGTSQFDTSVFFFKLSPGGDLLARYEYRVSKEPTTSKITDFTFTPSGDLYFLLYFGNPLAPDEFLYSTMYLCKVGLDKNIVESNVIQSHRIVHYKLNDGSTIDVKANIESAIFLNASDSSIRLLGVAKNTTFDSEDEDYDYIVVEYNLITQETNEDYFIGTPKLKDNVVGNAFHSINDTLSVIASTVSVDFYSDTVYSILYFVDPLWNIVESKKIERPANLKGLNFKDLGNGQLALCGSTDLGVTSMLYNKGRGIVVLLDSTFTIPDYLGVGIKSYESEANWSMYPNPIHSGGVLNLNIEQLEPPTEAKIYDSKGCLQMQFLLSEGSIAIDLPFLNPGIYLVRIDGYAEAFRLQVK